MSTIQCLAEKLPVVQIHPRLLLMEGHTLTWSSLGIQPAAREGVRKKRDRVAQLTSSVVPERDVSLGVGDVGSFEAVLVLEFGVYVG